MANHATVSPASIRATMDRTSNRLPPMVPARPGPGAAVRISSTSRPLPPSPASERNTSPVSTDSDVISLSQPRPDGERLRNEYIETPLKGGLGAVPLHAETHIHFRGCLHDHLALVPIPSSPSLKRLQKPRRSLPAQPAATAFAKDSGESTSALVSQTCQINSSKEDSIICPDCSRCRCQSCRSPRKLPSRWLCGDKCLCSAESFVDYASCLCCVKGLFYHCSSDDDVCEDDDSSDCGQHARGGSCADAPCSCAPSHHRLARWGCLASLSLVLPCLLCYWPLRGGVKMVDLCYQRCTRTGCRCDQAASSTTAVHRSIAGQVSHNDSSKTTVVSSQPLPSLGKRLLDI